MRKFFLILFAVLISALPIAAAAHQPRIPEVFPVQVTEPEISKAYYSHLAGSPQDYIIEAKKDFNLYVGLVVPDIAGQQTGVSALVVKDGNYDKPLALLDGTNHDWTKFFEPFGHDDYLEGPDYEGNAGPGTYTIRVFSQNNNEKYSLAVGKVENFDFKETANALNIIPKLKTDFFEKSPADFIFSPLGIGYILAMFALGGVGGFIYRLAQWIITGRHLKTATSGRIRHLRLALAAWLLLVAILTSWSPLMLFIAGILLFLAFF